MRIKKVSRFKFKETALSMVVTMMLGLAFVIPHAANAVSLKQNTIIQDETIKLGDIFDGVETKKNKVLGPAPLPGHDMVLNARTLLRIAMAMDLQWRPQSSAEQVVLSRAATIIDRNMIDDALKNALSDKGVPGKFSIVMRANEPSRMVLPAGEAQSVDVKAVSFDPARDTFTATLVAPSIADQKRSITVSGLVDRIVEVPVLLSPAQKGDIIRARHIDVIEVPAKTVNHDVILDREALIGMTPRRMILSGKPVKVNELQAPQIVERGEYVTMLFANGGLSLTAQGKALESGAKGDLVRVVNSASSKTIEARVTNEKEVTVTAFQ